ncbi:MAG: hypothetical protein AB1611_05865 [bacterium]
MSTHKVVLSRDRFPAGYYAVRCTVSVFLISDIINRKDKKKEVILM